MNQTHKIGNIYVELESWKDTNSVIMTITGMITVENDEVWEKYELYRNGYPMCTYDEVDNTFYIQIDTEYKYFCSSECDMLHGTWIKTGIEHPMTYDCALKIIEWIRKCSDRLHELNEQVEEMKSPMEIFRETMNAKKIDERLKAGEDPVKLVIEKYTLIKEARLNKEYVNINYYMSDYCALCHVYKVNVCKNNDVKCPLSEKTGFKCGESGSIWKKIYTTLYDEDTVVQIKYIDELLDVCNNILKDNKLDLSPLFDGDIPMKDGDVKVTVRNVMTDKGERMQQVEIVGLTPVDDMFSKFKCEYPKYYKYDDKVSVYNKEEDNFTIYFSNHYYPEYVERFITGLREAVIHEREIKAEVEMDKREWDGGIKVIII